MCVFRKKKGVLYLILKLSRSEKAWIKMFTTGYDRCYTDGEKDVGKTGKRGFGKTTVAGEILLIK